MLDAHLDDLWRAALASWDDDARHAAFVEHCRATEQLGAAAARYRAEARRAAEAPEQARRAQEADKRLRAITALALMELSRSAAAEPERSRVWPIVLRVAVALMLLGTIAVFVLVSR